MDKLYRKIVLQKLTEDAGFSAKEQAEVQAEVQGGRDVAAELKLNRLLASAHTSQTATQSPAPTRNAMLADVSTRAQSERSYYKRRAIMLAVRKSWPVAATVLVVAIAVMLGTILGQSEIAWATVDGYLLEYTLKFDEHYSGTVDDLPDHPILQIERALAEWNMAHEQVGAAPLAEMEITRSSRTTREPKHLCTIQLRLLSDSDELLQSLTAAMAKLDFLAEPEVFSDTWYYSQKYPDNHFPGRQVVINGVAYSYPMDFSEQELDDLSGYLSFTADIKGVVYVAFLEIDQQNRFQFADLVTITMGSNRELIIADYGPLPDELRVMMPSWYESLYVYVSEFELDEDFEPKELIEASIRSAQTRIQQRRESSYLRNLRGSRLVFDLPQDDPAAAMSVAGELEEIAMAWVQDYPELVPAGEFEDLLRFKFVPNADEPRQWVVDLWYVDWLADSLKTAFDDRGYVPLRSFPTTPSPLELSLAQARTSQQSAEETPRLDMLLAYDLFDLSDEHGTDTNWALDNLSPAEIQHCVNLTQKMQAAYDEWLADYNAVHNPTKLAAIFSPVGYANSEVLHSVSVMTSLTGVELENLIKTLALSGVPEPRRVSQKGYMRMSPLGMVIRCQYIPTSKFKEIMPEDALDQISPAELAQLEGAKEMVQQAFDAWMLDHAGKDGSADYEVQAELQFRNYGEVPVGFFIQTNLAHGSVFDSLQSVVTPTPCFKINARESYGYNAGPKSPTQKKRFEFPKEFFDNQIISYSLLPNDDFYVLIYDTLTELFDPAMRVQQDQVLAEMQLALEQWNQDNPPDADKDETPATLDFYEIDGLIHIVSVKCNRLNRKTMESLGEALAVPGAPVYQYGIAFLNRHSSSKFSELRGNPDAETETLYGAKVFYNLIPQIYWSNELEHKVTDERMAWSIETAQVLTQIFDSWLATHPELMGKFEPADPITSGWTQKTHGFNANEWNGKVRQVNIHIFTPVECEGQRLIEELIEAFSVVEGIDGPYTRFNLEREFHSLF